MCTNIHSYTYSNMLFVFYSLLTALTSNAPVAMTHLECRSWFLSIISYFMEPELLGEMADQGCVSETACCTRLKREWRHVKITQKGNKGPLSGQIRGNLSI